MTIRDIRSGDVRELLGLRTPAATILVSTFVLAFGLIAGVTAPVDAIPAGMLAWVLVSVAAVVLIRAGGDPLPPVITGCIAAAGPLAAALTIPVLPGVVERSLQLWSLPATVALGAYLCVRGRIWAGWASMLLASAVCWTWAAVSGYGVGPAVVMSALNVAPMLMATFFALTVRPATREIFELQREGTAAAAAEAAHLAHLEERDRQLVRLDDRARPYPERLARPAPLTVDEQRWCALAEARLRDGLRAPVLDGPELVDAAWRARSRGVEVVLLDDHGLDDSSADARESISRAVVAALDSVESGTTVTVRVLPPQRSAAVTVVQVLGDTVARAEYSADGERICR
ncbi:MAG: hypothetical protein WAW85_06780 [Gordonia sp. (in: high G+C Gram-positive bacteria)]|uniref:hypothetical protein n=1 Tax=Gordonia sp. (in: high G+C Gram-positive bacteria) TaxID=84139 RepID=UPI003BB6C461